MSILRRAILAFALMAGLAPAFAQAPPPVPALPDTERRTSYSITASQCACNVNFALYGDSTDYQNWVEVWLNGTNVAFNDPTFGWKITSPSGSLGFLPLPITDAVLTFNNPQTGTVQIVGARRPRRVSQFNENAGVSARNLNQAITDVVAMLREVWDKINDVTGRGIFAPPGETMNPLPPAASRASQGACFDSNGNLTSCVSVPSSTFSAGNGISFTGANPTTIKNNIQAGSGINITGTNPLTIAANISFVRSPYTGAASLQTSDCGKAVGLGGSAFYTFTVPAASGFSAVCPVVIVNEDNVCPALGAATCRGKLIAINGYTSFILWPGQTFLLVNQNSAWQYQQPGRWKPLVTMTWHINHATGQTTAGATDGLGTSGLGEFATIQQCVNVMESLIDFGQADSGPVCQNDPETFTENNVVHTHPLTGFHVISINGNVSNPGSVVWQVSGSGNVGLQCRDGGMAIITGFSFASTGSANTFINGGQAGVADFGALIFGANPGGYDINVSPGGSMNFNTGQSMSITGSMTGFALISGEGHLLADNMQVSMPNALTFTSFVQINAPGFVSMTNSGYTGSGSGSGSTGSKFSVNFNGVLSLGSSTLPGASAGTTSAGGQQF
jgi:hypothetical protein